MTTTKSYGQLVFQIYDKIVVHRTTHFTHMNMEFMEIWAFVCTSYTIQSFCVVCTWNFNLVSCDVPNEISVIYYNLVHLVFFSRYGFSQSILSLAHFVGVAVVAAAVNRMFIYVCQLANSVIHFNQTVQLGAIEKKRNEGKEKYKLNGRGN